MSTHKIQFDDKISLIICFLELSKKKRVRINHGKRAIGVRAVEVRLYIFFFVFLVFLLLFFFWGGGWGGRCGGGVTRSIYVYLSSAEFGKRVIKLIK